MNPLTTSQLRALRLTAQLLAPAAARPPLPDASHGQGARVHAVAAHMLASQAQNLPAGVRALGLRAGNPALTEEDLTAAHVVRSWSQRGTHHLLAPEDLRWLTRLCTPRVQKASAKRRGQLGLSDVDVDACRTALMDALGASSAPLPRSEAYRVFTRAGIDPEGGRGPHMLRHFGGEGDIVQGPRSSAAGRPEDTFVLHDSVVTDPRNLDGEDALRELACRYYRSRGPAGVKDLAWWSGLTVRDARAATALALATGTIVEGSTQDGRSVLLADWQADVTAAEITRALDTPLDLPAFDEYLLGYAERSDVISDAAASDVGPTKNGLFHPCRVEVGAVTGRL